MVETNPIGVSLTIHSYNGNRMTGPNNVIHINQPLHYAGPLPDLKISHIRVGERASFYANVIHNVEGMNVQGYIHLRKGNYAYATPIQLLTAHNDIIA